MVQKAFPELGKIRGNAVKIFDRNQDTTRKK